MSNKPLNRFWSGAGSIHWQTPESILEPARRVFGGAIDLDPCAPSDRSHWIGKQANLVLPRNGLTETWSKASLSTATTITTAFVNHPFGTSYVNGADCISKDEYSYLLKLAEGKDPRSDYGHLDKEDRERVFANARDELLRPWVKQTTADWVAKAVQEARAGMEVIWISKASLEQQALQTLMAEGVTCVLRGRLGYVDPATRKQMNGPTFGSIVTYLGDRPGKFVEHFESLGVIVNSFQKGRN